MSNEYTAEQFLSVKRNTAGGCTLTKAEADQLGEMMEQAAQMMRVGGSVTDGITVEVVGRVERDATGELGVNWSVEGGVHAVEEGSYIYCTDRDDFMPDDGVTTLYTAPEAPSRAAVPDLTNWQRHYSINDAAVNALRSLLAAAPEVTE